MILELLVGSALAQDLPSYALNASMQTVIQDVKLHSDYSGVYNKAGIQFEKTYNKGTANEVLVKYVDSSPGTQLLGPYPDGGIHRGVGFDGLADFALIHEVEDPSRLPQVYSDNLCADVDMPEPSGEAKQWFLDVLDAAVKR
jgi:hypothetical protein